MPVVHLEGGWHDFFLPETLAGYTALVARRQVRLLVGPWPPAHEATPWFLRPDRVLSRIPHDGQSASSRYRYDPADPTLMVGGTQAGLSAGAKDNRAIEARADVLTFTTAPWPTTSRPSARPACGCTRARRASEHEIFHDHQHPSALWLPLIPGAS